MRLSFVLTVQWYHDLSWSSYGGSQWYIQPRVNNSFRNKQYNSLNSIGTNDDDIELSWTYLLLVPLNMYITLLAVIVMTSGYYSHELLLSAIISVQNHVSIWKMQVKVTVEFWLVSLAHRMSYRTVSLDLSRFLVRKRQLCGW